MENEQREPVGWRGGFRTGDAKQPVIFTANLYPTDREAMKAARRAARFVGYTIQRSQVFATPIFEGVGTCEECEGSGEEVSESGAIDVCIACAGTGVR